jgi:hypothetical protein
VPSRRRAAGLGTGSQLRLLRSASRVKLTHCRRLTLWTPRSRRAKIPALPTTETRPLAASETEATAATERLAAWVIGALTAIVIGGVAIVIYVPR